MKVWYQVFADTAIGDLENKLHSEFMDELIDSPAAASRSTFCSLTSLSKTLTSSMPHLMQHLLRCETIRSAEVNSLRSTLNKKSRNKPPECSVWRGCRLPLPYARAEDPTFDLERHNAALLTDRCQMQKRPFGTQGNDEVPPKTKFTKYRRERSICFSLLIC